MQTLSLYKHPMQEKDIQHLANALRNSMVILVIFSVIEPIFIQALTTLDLYNNGLGDNGAKYLADALEYNTTLVQLHVRWNQIGDVGAQYLANTLRENKTLTTLNLRLNKITTTGAEHFRDTLQNSKALTTIYLDRNDPIQSESNQSMEDCQIKWINL
ncbi:unnamed protein product [Rotaria sp. Silwood1]|nr:unnamed protein product [Rotaria sp. Silwood1]